MMTDEIVAVKERVGKICAEFCPYFKPPAKENLACLGLVIADRLAKKGKLHFSALRIRQKKNKVNLREKRDYHEYMRLEKMLCGACSFASNDCDFASSILAASPCGGFIFLSRLLDKGCIPIGDISRITNSH